jgi:Ca-activated chloride channel family protein
VSLGAPGFLLLLLAVPAIALALAAWWRWRARARARFGAVTAPPGEVWRDVAAATLLLAAVAFAAFAAARPQFGRDEADVEQRGIDLVIVLDLSQSMLAADAKPSRLERAQAEIDALLERMQGDHVGLVVFAGRPFVRSPLTSDLRALRGMVHGVGDELRLVPPGSDLGPAIREGQRLALGGEAQTKALLIVSDGEDHGDSAAAAVADAKLRGLRVYTAGVGTSEGAPVRRYDPATGRYVPRAGADGEPLVTRLDDAALRTIAATGDGRFVALGGEGRPLATLADDFASLPTTTFEREEAPEALERFQIVVAVALALLVGELLLARAMRRAPLPRSARLWPAVAGALFVAALCSTNAADLNRAGNRHYVAGEYAAALQKYHEAQTREAGSDELRHNASNALNSLGQYNGAVDEAAAALPGEDRAMEALLRYALGNHFDGAGRLDEAIDAYRRALLADPADSDAKHNIELLRARLDATPQPTPTPAEPQTQPGDDAQGTPDASGGAATPGATPGDGEPQPSEADLPPEALRRTLEEALRGIDQEFTVEEAVRVLDLLEEQNRRATEETLPRRGVGPDY